MAAHIGSRCDYGGHRGTIRYHGEVSGTSGTWFGVEWDEKRGKHNGTHQDKFYFSCNDGYGSFIRQEKVNFGISLKEAIKQRYDADSNEANDSDLYVLGDGTQKTVVEVVGFDKVHKKLRQLDNLKKVSVVEMCINGVDDDKNLNEIIPSVHQLDISRNLFYNWLQIITIIKPLRHLEILDVSGNRVSVVENSEEDRPVTVSLKTLFANRMNLNWDKIIDLLEFTPNLADLHVCFNGIQNISTRRISTLDCLRLLNLEGNAICDWDEILKLSCLQSLETLILNDNNISKIQFPAEAKDVGFRSLIAISLNHNQISEWSSINQLALLPSFTKLKFKWNPLTKGRTSLDLRIELIARLKHIKVFNGSEVPTRERMDSEMLYLKQYGDAWRGNGGTEDDLDGQNVSQEFQELHPRFLELIHYYGPPAATVRIARTLKDKLISLRFKCADLDGSKTITKKVPVTMTIQQIRSLLQRLFKIQAAMQQVSYLDSKTQKEVKMDDNLRDLAFYSITENDLVLVRS